MKVGRGSAALRDAIGRTLSKMTRSFAARPAAGKPSKVVIATAASLRIDAGDAINFCSDAPGTDLAFQCRSGKVSEKRRK